MESEYLPLNLIYRYHSRLWVFFYFSPWLTISCSRPKASRLSERISRIEQLLAENLMRDSSPGKFVSSSNEPLFTVIAMAIMILSF